MAQSHRIDDRISAIEAFERSTRAFVALLDGMSGRAWHARPADREWSIAETVEHVVLSDRAILARLQKVVPGAPLAPEAPRFDDAAISAGMFATGAAAPAFAPPTGRFATRGEAVAALDAAHDVLLAWSLGRDEDLRAFGLPHPLFGTFDGVQWLLFAAAHTDSHAADLRALRRHPEVAAV